MKSTCDEKMCILPIARNIQSCKLAKRQQRAYLRNYVLVALLLDSVQLSWVLFNLQYNILIYESLVALLLDLVQTVS